MLSSLILGAVAVPFLPRHAGPLAIAQARRPQSTGNSSPDVTNATKPTRSQTIAGPPAQSRKSRHNSGQLKPARRPSRQTTISADTSPEIQISSSERSLKPLPSRSKLQTRKPSPFMVTSNEGLQSTSSLPDSHVRRSSPSTRPPSSSSTASIGRSERIQRRHSLTSKQSAPPALSRTQQIRLLRSHYFHCETAFLTALEDISSRLLVVPKAARLSALRAELALIAQDLPAEVDFPVICPAALVDGTAGRSQHHRIVRINPAEATSLNSAERVPYLLTVEILRKDFDFDPDTQANKELLHRLMEQKRGGTRRLFDITDAARDLEHENHTIKTPRPTDEAADGDLGSTSLIQEVAGNDSFYKTTKTSRSIEQSHEGIIQKRSPSLGYTISPVNNPPSGHMFDSKKERTDSTGSQKAYPKHPTQDQQQDVTALATHMRTASQMLTQLSSTTSKRPKAEVAAIQAKIIASMQTLEEQNFTFQDPSSAAIANTDTTSHNSPISIENAPDLDDDRVSETDPASHEGAGAARMENDQKTGAILQGDRDDPSAATFGEEWSAKKERIRRSSPYGWMKNWDLVSVIVKTGADLRQEAFASQLIQICDKIWQHTKIPVWVKTMRILVSGESSGLIETITNGVSLHSLKRSLTMASIAAGTNPRRRIASLRDHFIKAFGEPDSERYAAGAKAFARSLAAYSIISYVLQLKDRHNGNILIDNAGHIIHIDFGFMLSNSPGSMGFEAAPFKLTHEYVDVLGGVGAPGFDEFRALCKRAFQALRKDADRIVMLVNLMGRESKMPCFAAGVTQAVSALRARFVLHLSKDEAEGFVEELIQKSLGSYYTRL